jgi:hypothetical protein
VAVLAAVHSAASAAEQRKSSAHASASERAARTRVARSAVVPDSGASPQVGEAQGAQGEYSYARDDREPSWRTDRCRDRDRSWRGSWSWDDRDRWGRSSRCHREDGDQPATLPDPDRGTGAGEDDGGLPPWIPESPESPASPEAPAEQPTAPEAPAAPPGGQIEPSAGDAGAPAEPAAPVDPAIP